MNVAIPNPVAADRAPVTPPLLSREQGSVFDEDGFVCDTDAWNLDLAGAIAREEGIDRLGYEHWRVLHYIREYYGQFGAVPMLRRVCRENGIRRQEIKRLFSSCRSAWRIAGLPNPGEEAKSYMN